MTNEYPEPGELADANDQLGWIPDRHGRMRDLAAPDDAVKVERAPKVEQPEDAD